MTLEIGKNTYVLLEEFKEYIKTNVLSNDPVLIYFKEIPDEISGEETNPDLLSDNDIAIYLVNSARQIDALPFIGRHLFIGQKMAFPILALCVL